MANNRCGACKFLEIDRCDTEKCVFAPYFPNEKQKMFEQLDKIFGADFIYKTLSEPKLLRSQGEGAVRSLIYAAEAHIRDPIFGIVSMYLEHEKELETIEEKINSAKNELATIVGFDKVLAYYDLPISDVGFSTSSSLTSIIEKIERLNAIQKNQLMQLPSADAQKILNEMFGKREDQEMRVGHEAAGTSISARPSMT